MIEQNLLKSNIEKDLYPNDFNLSTPDVNCLFTWLITIIASYTVYNNKNLTLSLS